jgi:hypothetical protein
MINRKIVMYKLQCSTDKYPQCLEEKYPHVLLKAVTLWDSPDCEEYLNDLLKPNYSGGRHQREGFPTQAWDEIFQLLKLYKKPRPQEDWKSDSLSQSKKPNVIEGFLRVFQLQKSDRE